MQRYEEKLRKKENYRVVAHLIENPRGSLKVKHVNRCNQVDEYDSLTERHRQTPVPL